MIVTMQDYTITDRAPVLIGYEGENLSRNFTVKTFDDLSGIASIELLIGDVNCGAMTVNNTDDTEITISLDSFMIGRAGYKKAQLIMLDDTGAVIMKSNQFDVLVGASNNPRYYAAGEKVKTLTVSIDGRTRQIILPAGFAVSVNGDVAVDHIAFKAPASYGDFNFSAAACRVDWTGVDGTSHTTICTEKDADGNWIWALPTALTRGGEGEISFSVSYIVTDATTGAVTADWNTGLVKFYHLESAKSDDAEEDVEEETTYDRLASAIAAVQSAQASVDDVNAILAGITSATPTVVETVADLNGLDTSKVKLAIVAADGYLYYYDGTAWKSGFAYGGLQEVIAARTDSDGVTHADLKTRLNTAEAQLKEDLSAKRGYASILGYNGIIFGYGRIEIDTESKTISVSTAYTIKIGKIRLNNTSFDISNLDTTAHQTIYYDGTEKKIKITGYSAYGNLSNVNNTAILGSVWPANSYYPRGFYSLNTNMPVLVDGVRQIATIDTMKGLSIDAFGDSICQMRTDTGSGTATYASVTLKLLSEKYLGIPYNSHAVGGKHWCNFGGALDLYGQLSAEGALNGKVVLIWAGTNDYSGSAPIGTIDDAPNWDRVDTGNGTFFSNAKYCLDYIYSLDPATEIVLITPTYRNYYGSTIGNAYTTVQNAAGHTLGDYCDAIVELGRYYNIPVLDMRDNCPFNERTISSMVVEQGEGTGKYLHPKNATYTILNRKIVNWLKTVL